MDGKHNWNAQKKDMKKLSSDELMKVLEELKKEKFALENALHYDGKLNDRISYGSFSGSKALPNAKWSGGNMKKINKTIAYVMTILHVKLKNG